MPHTYNEAATSASDVTRYITTKLHGCETWEGLIMGEFEKCHDEYKQFAKTLRLNGYRCRLVTIAGGTIGVTGVGANMVKRSVIIVPHNQKLGDDIYNDALKLESMYW